MHFLVSMVLVWLAVQLVGAASDGRRGRTPAVVGARCGGWSALEHRRAGRAAGGRHTGHRGRAARRGRRTPRLGIGVPRSRSCTPTCCSGTSGLLVGLGFALAAVAAPPRLWRRYRACSSRWYWPRACSAPCSTRSGCPRCWSPCTCWAPRWSRWRAAALWAATVERPARRRFDPRRLAPGAAGADPDPVHDRPVRAIQITESGGPDVLTPTELPDPRRARASCWSRWRRPGSTTSTPTSARASTRWRCPPCSAWRAAGRVRELGEGVTEFAVGDRVAWAEPPGSYAELAARAGRRARCRYRTGCPTRPRSGRCCRA